MIIKILIPLLFAICVQSQPSDKIFNEGASWLYEVQTIKNGKIERTDTLTLRVEKGNFMISQQKISWGLTNIRTDGSKVEILSVTGVVENNSRIWLHPPRLDYLKFTELTAFPEVKFPIDKNKTWTSTISIGKGWGEWENHKVESKYEVIECARPSDKSTVNCKIKAISESNFGTYQTEYVLDFKRGFTYIKYFQPDNISTELKLVEFKEK